MPRGATELGQARILSCSFASFKAFNLQVLLHYFSLYFRRKGRRPGTTLMSNTRGKEGQSVLRGTSTSQQHVLLSYASALGSVTYFKPMFLTGWAHPLMRTWQTIEMILPLQGGWAPTCGHRNLSPHKLGPLKICHDM